MEKFNAKVVSMLFPKKGQPQPDNGYAIVAVAPEDKGLFGDEIIVKGNNVILKRNSALQEKIGRM